MRPASRGQAAPQGGIGQEPEQVVHGWARASRCAFAVLVAAGVILPALWAISAGLGTVAAPSAAPTSAGSGLRSSETSGISPPLTGPAASPSSLGADQLEWIPLSGLSPIAPPARGGNVLAFDPAAGATILFGGEIGYGTSSVTPLNDTWSLTNGSWSHLAPETAPPASVGDTLAYDSSTGGLVLVAVTHASADSAWNSATWNFSAGGWTELTGAGHVAPTAFASMTYDPARGELVRFGGLTTDRYGGTHLSNVTQVFANGTWSNAPSGPEPPAGYGGAVAYDPDLGGVVLFGGEGLVGMLSDTWLFGASGWVKLTPAHSPTGLVGASAAWDPRLDAVVVDGGSVSNGYASGVNYSLNRTWVFQSGDWSSFQTSSASPLVAMGASAFDPRLGAVVSFGGWGYPNASAAGAVGPWPYYVAVNSTFAVAESPAPVAQAESGPHEVGVPVGFSDLLRPFAPGATDLWTFGDGGFSSAAAPSHTYDFAGSYSVRLNATVALSNGVSSGESSTTVAVLPSLSLRVGASGSFTDPYRPIQIEASLTGGAAPFALRWTFGDGSSGNGTTVVQHAYSAPGTYSVTVVATDVLGVARTAQVTVHVEPFAQAYIALASPYFDLGQTLTLSTQTVNGSGPLTFSYEGLPDGCASVNARNLSCVPTATGAYTIEAFVRDVDGVTVDSPVQTVVIYPPLSASLHASSSAIDVGQSFSLSATFDSVGSGNVSWSLPGSLGCSIASPYQATCAPASPGVYPLTAFVSDRAGASEGLTTVSVVVSPRVALGATGPGTTVARGTIYALSLQTAGGTAPYRYSYTSLPEGCVSVNATTFRCYAAQPGALAFGATVLDAVGGSSSAHLVVYVSGDAVGPSQFAPPTAPPSIPGGIFFWLVVAAAVVEIVLSVRYARRPRRRRRPLVRKGLWSEAGSPPLDGFDDDEAPAAELLA